MSAPAAALDPRVPLLAAEAQRFAAQGNLAAAARAWGEVLALDPRHSGALCFQGVAALGRGELEQARDLLERATRGQPPSAIAHAQLARVHQAGGRHQEALHCLDQALKIEPGAYAAHLEKAKIYGLLGRGKDQALAYESALRLMPESVARAPEFRAVVERAQAAAAANRAALAAFLDQHLAEPRSGLPARALERFDESVDVSLGRKPLQLSRPALFHVPSLPSVAFYDRADFPWAREAEAATDAIRAELMQVLAGDAGGFIPYVQTRADEPAGQFAALDRNPDWSAYFLWQHGRRVDAHVARCPDTMAMLERVPQIAIANRAPAAFFSALKAGTHIPPHNGATNCRLTVHLPLVIPPDCGIRVGNQVRGWTPGELLLFDDTIEHEAWNRSTQLRVVLIFDVWHPLLTDTERRLIQATLEGLMAYYGHDAPLGEL